MTVATQTSRVSYAGDGTSTIFAVPFRFLENGDLRVILVESDGTESVQTLNVDYTVSGAGASSGQVTMSAAPANDETLVILRVVPLTQETDYQENDPFPAETHERALDKLTMATQQLAQQAAAALLLPESEDPADYNMRLPPEADRAGRYLSFDAQGDPEALNAVVDVATVAGIAADVTAVAAIDTDVTAVAAIDTDVTAVATNIAAVIAAPAAAAAAQQSADDADVARIAAEAAAASVNLPSIGPADTGKELGVNAAGTAYELTVRNRFTAPGPPTIFDDETQGFGVGSQWGLPDPGSRENVIPNNSMAGALVGTIGSGGAAPTGWTLFSGGLTTEVIAVAADGPLNRIRVRVSGTPTSSPYFIVPHASTGPTIAQGETWTASIYAALVSGNFTNVSAVRIDFQERDAGFLAQSDTTITIGATRQRFTVTRTITNATANNMRTGLSFGLTVGQAVDFTIDVWSPQAELGTEATANIPTAGTAQSVTDTDSLYMARAVDDGAAVWTPLPTLPAVVAGDAGKALVVAGTGTVEAAFAGFGQRSTAANPYDVVADDNRRVIWLFSTDPVVNLPAVGSGAAFECVIVGADSSNTTINADGSDTIIGANNASTASYVLGPRENVWLRSLPTTGFWYVVSETRKAVAVQRVYEQNTAVFQTTAQIPIDDTIPQIGEGTEWDTLAITPKFADSLLVVEVHLANIWRQAGSKAVAAIFRDATANAIAAVQTIIAASAHPLNDMTLRVVVAAAAVTATTFRVRFGASGDAAGNFSINASATTTRIFGGVSISSITITEVRP